MKRAIKLFIFAALLCFAMPSWAERFQCTDDFLSQYKILGPSPNLATPLNTLYRFKQVRDDLLAELNGTSPDSDKIECLKEFYKKAMEASGKYWGRRINEPSCNEKCRAEFERSRQYLNNLDKEFKNKITTLLNAREGNSAVAPAACPAPTVRPEEVLRQTHRELCCGKESSTEEKVGHVRGLYPEINYQTCLGKIAPTEQNISSADGLSECVGNIVSKALQAVWENVTALLDLPAELWAARNQIWSLMTDEKARAEFATRISKSIDKFIEDRFTSLSACLNSYEQSQYTCMFSGEIIGLLASPAAITKLFALAKASAKTASDIILDVLAKNKKGQTILKALDRSEVAAQEAIPIGGKNLRDSSSTKKLENDASGVGKRFASLEQFAKEENPFDAAFRAASKEAGDADYVHTNAKGKRADDQEEVWAEQKVGGEGDSRETSPGQHGSTAAPGDGEAARVNAQGASANREKGKEEPSPGNGAPPGGRQSGADPKSGPKPNPDRDGQPDTAAKVRIRQPGKYAWAQNPFRAKPGTAKYEPYVNDTVSIPRTGSTTRSDAKIMEYDDTKKIVRVIFKDVDGRTKLKNVKYEDLLPPSNAAKSPFTQAKDYFKEQAATRKAKAEERKRAREEEERRREAAARQREEEARRRAEEQARQRQDDTTRPPEDEARRRGNRANPRPNPAKSNEGLNLAADDFAKWLEKQEVNDLSDARRILGIDTQANLDQARKASRGLLQTYHPDKFIDPVAKEKAGMVAAKINRAIDMIKAEEKRKK